jgi:hypothetical protein
MPSGNTADGRSDHRAKPTARSSTLTRIGTTTAEQYHGTHQYNQTFLHNRHVLNVERCKGKHFFVSDKGKNPKCQ